MDNPAPPAGSTGKSDGLDGTGGNGETPAARAARWRPLLAMPEDAPLIRRLSLDAGPSDAADTLKILGAVSGLAAWAADTGTPVDEDLLTDPAVARAYADAALPGLTPAWRARLVVLLDRVCAARPEGRPAPAARPPRPASDYTTPYDASQVDALLRWADGRVSPTRRHSMLVALAAGLGAGLTADDLLHVRGTDVLTAHDGTVTVQVRGDRPRTTVALRRYERLLGTLAASAADRWLLAPDREPTGAESVTWPLREDPPPPGTPPITMTRCRTTWTSAHLAAGTRLDVLTAASGLVEAGALADRIWPNLPPQDPDDAVRSLRAARHPDDSSPPTRDHPAAPTSSGPARRPGTPGTPSASTAEAAAALVGYVPKTGAAEHVPLIRLVAAASSARTATAAVAAGTTAADLVAWAHRHGHPTRTPADVLDPAVADAWAAAPDGAARWTPVTRGARLRYIRHAAAAVLPDRPPAPRPPDPYTRADVDRLTAWARGAPGPRTRRILTAATALGLGTGATTPEWLTITGHDILQDPRTGAVLATLSGRTVPCLHEHEDDLLAAAHHAGAGWLIDPTVTATRARKHLAAALNHRPPPPGTPAIGTRRCRTTWLRAHLASGTRLDTTLTAAGLTVARHLTTWVPTLPDVDPNTAAVMLRNAGLDP